MRKRFRGKKKKKKIVHIAYVILFFSFLFLLLYLLFQGDFQKQTLSYLLNDNQPLSLYQKNVQSSMKSIASFISQIQTNEPLKILEDTFYYQKETEKKQTPKKKMHFVSNQKNVEEEKTTGYDIYIYSTHQTEEYEKGTSDKEKPTVYDASYVLKQNLESLGYRVLVEDRKMSDYLTQNNLDYSKSYTASRTYLNTVLKENPNLKLVIDFHRDALERKYAVGVKKKKNYAKVLFVVGKASKNYQNTHTLVNKMNEYLKTNAPYLTRGVLEREGSYYNQDMHPSSFLLEVGGHKNTYDEVLNSIPIISRMIDAYLKG